jgi:integrase
VDTIQDGGDLRRGHRDRFPRLPHGDEELALVPEEERKGPLIIRTRGGLPYSEDTFQEVWRDVRKAAGVPKDIWNRDLRASGSTEARAAGAPIDDVKKLMGHTARSETTAKVSCEAGSASSHRRRSKGRPLHGLTGASSAHAAH